MRNYCIFSSMKLSILIGAFIISLLAAAANNATNKHSIPWKGTPEVLEKPPGYPAVSISEGVSSGLKVAWKGFKSHRMPILIVLGALVAASLLMRSMHLPVSALWRSALRIGLGFMFLAAAWPKFHNPAGFSELVAQYQMLPGGLVNAFSLWLPAFEITVGLGFIVTAWEREFSVLIGLLLLMFIVALTQALYRDLGIACGCFDIEGAASAGETWFSLIRDVVLLVPVAWLVAGERRRYLWQVETQY